ncbi:hypothetical protein F4819DRAFT_250176 [Hypoxylon fuscum]|nr:hypothetical protein F4819DRAFT_250176 [Hypoxylon fuscum]
MPGSPLSPKSDSFLWGSVVTSILLMACSGSGSGIHPSKPGGGGPYLLACPCSHYTYSLLFLLTSYLQCWWEASLSLYLTSSPCARICYLTHWLCIQL